MDARDATANNADLWTKYLREQWSQALDPFHLASSVVADAAVRVLGEVAAANVAGMLTIFVGPGIARMYQANAPEVSRAIQGAVPDAEQIEIPESFAARPRPACSDLTQREEWIVSAVREPVPVG